MHGQQNIKIKQCCPVWKPKIHYFFFSSSSSSSPQKRRSRTSRTKNVSFLKSWEYFGLVVGAHKYRHEFLCHILSHKGPIQSQLN